MKTKSGNSRRLNVVKLKTKDNNTGKTVTKAVAVTAYDKNGKMLDTSYETVTLANNGEKTLTLSCAPSKEIATVKCFLLDGTSFAPTEIIWQQTLS